jgi:hypothetical protein
MLYVAQFQYDGDGPEWRDAELLSDMTYRVRNTTLHEQRLVAVRGTDGNGAKQPMVTLKPRGGPRILVPGASVWFPVTAQLCQSAYECGFQARMPEGWYMPAIPG